MEVPRIAFVLTQTHGGPVDLTVALGKHLDAERLADVRIFGPRPARGAISVAHLLEQTEVGGKHELGAIRAARARILSWRPDIVHAQDRRAGLVCMRLGRMRRPRTPKLVHTYHGVPDDVTQDWFSGADGAAGPSRYSLFTLAADAALARSMDCTVVPTDEMKTFLEQRLRVPPSRVRHIDNGLPLLAADPPSSITRFLFVGALIERKGLFDLLAAFAQAQTRRPELRLQIVGEGPARGELEGRSHNLGLSASVTFNGYRPDVSAVLAGADAFVLPSLMEQQPLVLIEAMIAGKPILATDVGGVRAMLAGSGDGAQIVATGDVDALAQGILALSNLAGPADAGRAIAKLAQGRFAVEACAARHLNLYRYVRAPESTP